MTKARTLADFISDGSPLADGTISVSEVSGAAPLESPTFTGTASGTFSGPLTGAVTGNVTGDLTGNVTGNVTGDLTGNVTAPFVSLVGTLPTLDFSTMLLQVAVSQATDPVAVGTWFDSTASDGYKYGDLDKSGSIGAQDGLLMNQLSAGLASEAVTSRWYNIIVPSLVTQSWYADLVTDGTILAGGTLDLTNGWTIEQEAGNFHVSKDNVTKLDIASDGIDVTGEVKADKFTNDEALPTVRPSLLLDFANSKTLDPRITFTRGSTATYWDGKTTTKAEENLITYSQSIGDSNWGESHVTTSINQAVAPDGTTTASTAVPTTTNTPHQTFRSFSAPSSATVSIYAKADGYDHIRLQLGGNSDYVYFNINAGTVGTYSGSPTNRTITSVGNGWYRCSFYSADTSGAANFSFWPANADNSHHFAGDGTSGIQVWGAQVEQRDALTAYTATTSSPIVKYQPTLQTAASGEARFDHDPVTGESKGLLIEESRTNLATYSEAFNSWTKLYSTVESNAAIAPDGTLTADKLVPDATNTTAHRVSIPQGFTSGTSYAFSVYAKAGEKQYIDVRWYDGSTNAARVVFDVASGTVTNTYAGTGVVEDVGNGWYRCAVYASATNTSISGFALIYVEDAGAGSVTYQGNGYDGLYLWGAQVEVGAFPTSYIPTSGSTVTRSADSASLAGDNFSSWYRQDEGTLYLDGTNSAMFALHEGSLGSYNNFWQLGSNQTYTIDNYMPGNLNSVPQWGFRSFSGTQGKEFAIAIKNNDIAGYIDGAQFGTDSVANVPANLDTAYLSTNGFGYFKKLAFYPQRLSNATLQAMTEE